MTRARVLLSAILLVVAVSLNGQQLTDTHLFPVISATPGLGNPPTQWVSDATVHNATDGSLTVGFQLLPEGQANVLDETFAGPLSLTIQLGPRATQTLENIVQDGFGLAVAVKGMLIVTASSAFFPANPDSSRLAATTRTYNVGSPDGTFGQTVAANIDLVNAYAEPTLVTGARQDAWYRSNLGVASLAMGGPVTVHYRVRRGDGSLAAQGTRTVEQLSMRQWSFASLGVANQDQPLTVEVSLDPADLTPDPCAVADQGGIPNAIFAYVSKVDGNPRGTGDAEYLPGLPSRPLECVD